MTRFWIWRSNLASDRVKAVISLILTIKERISDYETCLEGEKADTMSPRVAVWLGEANVLKTKVAALNALLWIFIHEDIPELLTKRYSAIRKGLTIVYMDTDEGHHNKTVHVPAAVIVSPPRKDPSEEVGNN